MPLFEFECLKCSAEFEMLVQKASQKKEVKCPKCTSQELEERISCFASGSGSANCAPSGGG
jgi:putative FmdB family regulatory protein